MPFLIGRPINGVTINGLEFVQNEAGDLMEFESKETAAQFLLGHGYTQEEIDNQFILKESNEEHSL